MYLIGLTGEHHPAQLTYTWEGELNGNQSLSAEILPSKVNLKYLHDLTEMWTIVVNDVEYKIVYLKKNGEGKLLKASIKATPLFFDKFNTQRVHKRVDQHMTANAFFNFVFHEPDELGNPSGYNFILNGTFDAVQWEGLAEGDTRLKMLQDGLNRYKAEFRIVGNTIYLENMIGIDSQFRYEHKLNASNIVQEIDASEMWTYAKGYGDYGDGEGGEDWQDANLIREYTSPLANIPSIGIREAPPIKNGNITTQSFMDSQLKILVDESLKISVSADIHDLRNQGYPIAQSSLGDRVFLIDPRIGFDEEIRVVHKSETRNWKGEIIALNLTFGVPGLVKRHQSSLNAAVKSINNLLEGKVKLPFSVYEARMQEAIKAMTSVLTELTVLPDGSLAAIDPENPNNMVMLKSSGLFLSEDGGATPKQAIWGGGINASVISTGTMLADRIAGGVLMSLNGNTEFNLNSGKLIMSNTDFELGGGADILFTDAGNRLYYRRNDWAAGTGVGTSINNTFPFAFMGVSKSGRPTPNDSTDFSGFIANANDRENVDAIGNSVVGNRFHVRDKSVSFDKGYVFNLNVPTSYFAPINTGTHDYDLGTENNRWNRLYINSLRARQAFEIRNYYDTNAGWLVETNYSGTGAGITLRGLNGGSYNYNIGASESWNWIKHTWSENVTSTYINSDYVNGTVVGTSTKNAKMEIEDIDGKQAFDYFDMMNIKSFFYTDSDYTNPYSRKVSPIIEQLDPVLENLYKATEEGLDIISNLFLLVSAFKHKNGITDNEISLIKERLEELENGTTTT